VLSSIDCNVKKLNITLMSILMLKDNVCFWVIVVIFATIV